MIVITLSVCPPALKGDLSKWLIEISTGVYCGNVNPKVREELWQRICDNIKSGRATMVYSSAGEQHLDFRICNSDWEPVDYDGIKLIRFPSFQRRVLGSKDISKTVLHKKHEIRFSDHRSLKIEQDYTILDLETTGLSVISDQIIEVAALKIRNDIVSKKYSSLVLLSEPVPKKITKMTGITTQMLADQGVPIQKVLSEVIEFIGEDQLVGFNLKYDVDFLSARMEECRMARKIWRNQMDIMRLAHQAITEVDNYKLITLASYFKTEHQPTHRALQDCYAAYDVLIKLKEIILSRQ